MQSNYASERIGENPSEQECDNVSEVAAKTLEEQDDGIKEEEDLADGPKSVYSLSTLKLLKRRTPDSEPRMRRPHLKSRYSGRIQLQAPDGCLLREPSHTSHVQHLTATDKELEKETLRVV